MGSFQGLFGWVESSGPRLKATLFRFQNPLCCDCYALHCSKSTAFAPEHIQSRAWREPRRHIKDGRTSCLQAELFRLKTSMSKDCERVRPE